MNSSMTRRRPNDLRKHSPGGPAQALLRLAGCALAVVIASADARAQDKSGASSGMTVTVERARQECFADTVRVAGTLVPQQESLVRPDMEGMRITQVLVEDGTVVTQGQALARLARPEGQPGQGPSTSSVQA